VPQKPGQVRIIGGTHRRRLIHFPEVPGLRPTPDRVRETLFNWLGQDLHGQRCLDVFAGSGALGFEAASRGAARVLMLESSDQAYRALLSNQALLGFANLSVQRMDAFTWLANQDARFDGIFLDPPFGMGMLERVLPQITACLQAGGWIYIESNQLPPLPAGFMVAREGRAGQSRFALLREAGVDGEPVS
jgi:16S rRNA (guanine(966)-N(2))-methyltransferase RsmD